MLLNYLRFPDWIQPEIIPGLPVRWYAMMYIFAFATAYILFMRQIKQDSYSIKKEVASDYFFWAILGLILGARIFSVLVYDQSGLYWRKPWLIFWPFDDQWNFIGLQGMSYHGGVIGCIVALIIFCKKRKLNFLELADYLCAAIPLGFTFGRLGNFINGELYGRVTTSPLGMIFPDATTRRFRTSLTWVQEMAQEVGLDISNDLMVNLPRHPSQLYEAFAEGILLWALLWFIFRKRKTFHGYIMSLYMIGFGAFRFIVEYFRQPDDGLDFPIMLGGESPNYFNRSLLNITTGQILSFLMVVGGVLLLIFCKKLAERKAAKTANKK